MKKILDFYDWLTNISSIDFSNKSVLLIGGGNISIPYVLALRELGVKDITIITNKGRKSLKFCKEKKVDLLTGGFEKSLIASSALNSSMFTPRSNKPSLTRSAWF